MYRTSVWAMAVYCTAVSNSISPVDDVRRTLVLDSDEKQRKLISHVLIPYLTSSLSSLITDNK